MITLRMSDVGYLAWFNEIPDQELTLSAGGKGAGLCRMFRAGFPVPSGFVVCSEMFNAFMRANNLKEKVLSVIDSIDFDKNSDLVSKAEKIRNAIISAPMPFEMSKMIGKFYLELCEEVEPDEKLIHPIAVRSSGTAEDLDDASFAGQQETFLYVMGADDVVRYIKECWASLYNDRAIFYRKEKRFNESEISIAVVVQRMVASIKSGVMFTANPITNDRNVCLIEGAWGLGEAIVSGIVTPDSYSVDKNGNIIDVFVACKEVMVARKIGEPGVEECDVPEELQEKQVLNDSEIKDLTDLAVKLENYFGKPQDVEWAIESGQLYVLQSRPITTLI